MDLLRSLGNPNKEFTTQGKRFLNYLELGADFMLNRNGVLKKIILHANQYQEPNFGFYDRCFFEIDKPQVSTVSKFSEIKDCLRQYGGDSVKYYENNPPSGGVFLKKTHVYGFNKFLLEIIPETDQICTLTLF